jgi:hypothetical protein
MCHLAIKSTSVCVGLVLCGGLRWAAAEEAVSRPASQPAASRPAVPYPGEQIREYRFEPGVAIHVNAPSPERFDASRLTRVILYTLPNGNTTAWTIGRKMAPGMDWHFDIQHIGAQTRRLREVVKDENIVVAYLEADGKSWPTWKSKHPDFRQIIPRIIDSVVEPFKSGKYVVELSGHSGGGSFVFGYLDSVPRVEDRVRRLSFLDSNYGYSNESGHGDKIVAWLQGGKDRCLSVICYDDRNVKLDGKNIVSPTGGTYRRTLDMVERIRRDIPLTESKSGDLLRYRGLDGRVDLILHNNPQLKILHTALVGPMNGFIHAMTVGTPYEDKAAVFNTEPAYLNYIQP